MKGSDASHRSAAPSPCPARRQFLLEDLYVRWAAGQILCGSLHDLAGLLLGRCYSHGATFALFHRTSAFTLCFGRSVACIARLSLRAFECPPLARYLCVYLGPWSAGRVPSHDPHADFRMWRSASRPVPVFLPPELLARRGCSFSASSCCAAAAVQRSSLAHTGSMPSSTEAGWRALAWAPASAVGAWIGCLWSCRAWPSSHRPYARRAFAHRAGGHSWIVEGCRAPATRSSSPASQHGRELATTTSFSLPAMLGLFPGQIDLGWC